MRPILGLKLEADGSCSQNDLAKQMRHMTKNRSFSKGPWDLAEKLVVSL